MKDVGIPMQLFCGELAQGGRLQADIARSVNVALKRILLTSARRNSWKSARHT